jgi:DNA-binding NtrC family response regulator
VSGLEKVLVVDDDPAVRRLVVTLLGTNGYQSIESPDGTHGLQSFISNRPRVALVLSDVDMPSPGPDMVAEILRIDSFVAVGFMSGTVDTGGLPPSLKHVPMLKKPFTSTQLLTFVRECLDRRRDALANS